MRCKKRQKPLPGQLLSKEYRAVRRSAVQLKDPLREVNADNRNLRHGCRSFSWPAEGRQGIHCNAAGRGHPRHQNTRSPCAGSRWPAEARGSRVPEPSALSPHPWEHQRAHHCRARPSSPTHAASAPCSRSWRRSTRPPPSATHARLRDPKPFAPRGRGPRKRTCWSSCLSWLHLLRSWSLRSTRSGSTIKPADVRSPSLERDFLKPRRTVRSGRSARKISSKTLRREASSAAVGWRWSTLGQAARGSSEVH